MQDLELIKRAPSRASERWLELDACDDGATALVAADRGVYMIRNHHDTGAPRLVRRWTLPDRAPWN